MCSRVAASVAYATGSWSETDTPYYIVDADRNLNKHGQPVHRYPGLVLSIDRLSDPNLLGHDMVVNSYQEYEARAIELSLGMKWSWKRIAPVSSCLSPPPPPPPLHPSSLSSILNMDLGNPLGGSFYPDSANPKYILVPHGRLAALRRRLFLTRDSSSLFDTQTWVRNLESGMMMAYKKFQTDWAFIQERNMREMQGVDDDEESSHEPASSMMSKPSRCLKIIIH